MTIGSCEGPVPWANLRGDVPLGSGGSCLANNERHREPATHRGRPRTSCKILSLLSARERVGMRNHHGSRSGWLVSGVMVTNSELSRAGAWNPRRLQNMILTVGPGTPASCILPSAECNSNSSSEGSFSDSVDSEESENSEENDGDSSPEERSEGQEGGVVVDEPSTDGYRFDSNRGRLVAGEATAATATTNTAAENETAAPTGTTRHIDARVVTGQRQQVHSSDDEGENIGPSGSRTDWERRQETVRNALMGNESEEEEEDDDNSSSSRPLFNIERVEQYLSRIESIQRRRERGLSFSSPARDRGNFNPEANMFEREVARSMKHGGCINTVSWLDSGWRISSQGTTSYSANSSGGSPYSSPPKKEDSHGGLVSFNSSTEYTSQCMTSGDDHLVKFWDVSQSMGSTSPIPGGSSTTTPFSSSKMPLKPAPELVETWKSHNGGCSSSYVGSHRRHMPGVVHPLITISSGHRGNVFHCTPVPNSPGKVATCAADGQLRLADVERHSMLSSNGRGRSDSIASALSHPEASTIVMDLDSSESDSSGFSRTMCFSHCFFDGNVGLVCSERGLLHFDLRLSARNQRRASLVPELSRTCKACYPWQTGGESAYVFAGGTTSTVGLYDLRMLGDTRSQVVQTYRPRALRSKQAAVSGIDLSKDKREILVSYEADHIYRFPCFPEAPAFGPSLEDINECSKDKPLSELAAYGGHLNRLTFLKSAKFAGPRDEFVCTGSDSGHCWIYEKRSGAVASFIKSDNSTANGILPHPELPFFLTYGIDSTAKLWRATQPVDLNVDDTDLGRFRYSQKVKYEKSIVTEKWKKARKGKEVDLEDDDLSFFPDETSTDDNDDEDHFLGIFVRSRFSSEPPYIGNDLMELCAQLEKNYFTCARYDGMGDDEPVRSGLAGFRRRVALIKLRNQADRLGLHFNRKIPWLLKAKDHLEEEIDGNGVDDLISYGCLADLVPDRPSSWIPFDDLMASPPSRSGMRFNKAYDLYHHDIITDYSVPPSHRGMITNQMQSSMVIDQLDAEAAKQPNTLQANEDLVVNTSEDEGRSMRAWDVLYQTVALLKDAGNAALKASLPHLAARRYDKAITYCAIAYLRFPMGNAAFLAEHQYMLSRNGGYEVRWTALVKTLITTRLNLSMCLLRDEIFDPKGAAFQAEQALDELRPFVNDKGVVLTGNKKLTKKRVDEPIRTYTEAKALQAKAYFRLGSAKLLLKEYDEAVLSFEGCIKSTGEAGMPVDAITLRKLNDARRRHLDKKERHRKKFKLAFREQSR